MAILQKIKNLYRSLPPWMTAGVRFIPDGALFGKSYRKCQTSVNVGDVISNLRAALDYDREHTAWGREHVPVNICGEEAVEILRKLPVVGSDVLAAEPERFVSDEATDYNSYWTTTGGSGRNPTSIRLSNASYGIEWKHMYAIWGDEYLRRRDLKLTFRGYHLKEGELVRFDPIYNELSVDPFQLNDGNFKEFIRRVQRYKVNCLHGYPSLISLFMERLKSIGETFRVKLIFLGSEGASVELKRKLSEFFSAKVISWYGQTEKVVLAYDADASGRFVNFSSYGYPWILNPDENGVGEIVGTTFVNKAMPLVNYRTGDYGRVEYVEREDGSTVMMIDQLQGRWGKDFVYRTKSEKIPTSAINLHAGIQEKIVFYQITQFDFGKISVKVLPKVGYNPDLICQELKDELCERLKGFEVSCETVKSDEGFVRSVRGKMIMLVQNLKV